MTLESLKPIQPYKALIFDCDGTLANTLPVHFKCWAAVLQSFDVEITKEWFLRHSGISALELIEIVNRTFNSNLDAAVVNKDRKLRYEKLIQNVKEIKEVADIARAHYQKVPMAVASGGDLSLVELTLNVINLRPLFDTIVAVNEVACGKPAPDIFLLAAQRLGMSPSDCIIYEDSDGGIEAASRAGMRVIDIRKFIISKL